MNAHLDDSLIDEIAEQIIDASVDMTNWRWSSRDNSCDDRRLMWPGELTVPGIGLIALAACVDLAQDGRLNIYFGSGDRAADIGDVHPDPQFAAEHPDAAALLREATRQALSELGAPGLRKLVMDLLRRRRRTWYIR